MAIKDNPSKHEKPPDGPAKQSITKAFILMLVLWIGLNGCVRGPFNVANGNIYSKAMNISTEIPESDWHYYTTYYPHKKNELIFVLLNKELNEVFIQIEKHPHDWKMAYTKKSLSRDMPLEQAAKIMEENLRYLPGAEHLEILDSGPAPVNGKPGYRLTITFQDNKGMEYKRIHQFYRENHSLYLFIYSAPKKLYFDKYLGIFEKVVAKFQIGESAQIKNFQSSFSDDPDS